MPFLHFQRLGLLLLTLVAWAAAATEVPVDTLFKQGVAFHDQGKYAEAIAVYQKVLAKKPAYPSANYEICYSFSQLKQYDSAAKYCRASIREGGAENGMDYAQLGTNFDYQEQPDSALASYQMGLAKFPHAYFLKYNMAVTLEIQKRTAEAFDTLCSAMADTKTHEGTYYMASQLANNQERWLDEVAYGMYSLLVGKNETRIVTTAKRLHREWKSLTEAKKSGKVCVKLPVTKEQSLTTDGALLLRLGTFIASDSSLSVRLLSQTTSPYAFLSAVGAEAVLAIAESQSDNRLRKFYQQLQRRHFGEAYAHEAFAAVGREEHRKWILNHQSSYDAFTEWLGQGAPEASPL